MTQEHCAISREDDGTIHAVSPERCLTILPDAEARAFNRNFKKYTPEHKIRDEKTGKVLETVPGIATHDRILVGELDGVRCYIIGNDIIMTKRDLYK